MICSVVIDDTIHIKNKILAKDNTLDKFNVREHYEFRLEPIKLYFAKIIIFILFL